MDKKEGKKSYKKSEEGLGVSGFTLGVLSIIFAGWIGIIIAIVGFIFCMIQQKRHATGLGKTGMILSVIGLIVSIVFIIITPYIINLIPQA